MKLFNTLNLPAPIDGLFGIEIEAEGHGMHEVKNKFWQTEHDGSLRGNYPETCAEFVLKKPVTRENVVPALESLKNALEGAVFDFSYRCSVHVHVNVQELTHTQVLNLIYTYLLLEEPLMNYCGKSRKANRFCLRLVDAEGVLATMSKLFRGNAQSVLEFNGDAVRYSALNLAALQKYGSLEFRAMRGNMDTQVIKTWTEALFHLRRFALEQANPKAILALFEKLGPKGFMQEVLQEQYDAFTYPRMVKEIQRSFSLSLDLPYEFKEVAVPKAEKIIGKKMKVNPFDVPMEGFVGFNPAAEIPLQPRALRPVVRPANIF